MHFHPPRARSSRAFTLVELLIVVVLLGLAGALVIPSMSSVGILRIQAAVRTLVSDLTFAQADAIAFQQRRAVVFDVPNSSYTLVQVLNGSINTATGALYNASNNGGRYQVSFANNPSFGGARIVSASFNGGSTLIFDDMGGPALDATSDQPGAGGTVRIVGSDSAFDVVIEPYTGRITVRRLDFASIAPTLTPAQTQAP